MFTLETIQEIVSRIKFRDWKLVVRTDGSTGGRTIPRPYLQIEWAAPDNDNLHGTVESQRSRKWFLSYHMCENEIIRTAYKAIQGAVEHEMNEQFTYMDVRIFDPHMDYTRLASAIRNNLIGQNNREPVK